ncbi:hypothetical protein [Longispora urticae]
MWNRVAPGVAAPLFWHDMSGGQGWRPLAVVPLTFVDLARHRAPGAWARRLFPALVVCWWSALFLGHVLFLVAADYGAAALEAYELGAVPEYGGASAASDTSEFTALGVYALAALCCALTVHQVTAAQRGRRADFPVVTTPTAAQPDSLVVAAPPTLRGPPPHTVADPVDAVLSGVPSW